MISFNSISILLLDFGLNLKIRFLSTFLGILENEFQWPRFTVYIINKSGGLIFYEDYGSAVRMDTNDSLRSASLWHSMHAISQHYRRLGLLRDRTP
ncbi:unnamed protein product, partial [Vitis vinifera]